MHFVESSAVTANVLRSSEENRRRFRLCVAVSNAPSNTLGGYEMSDWQFVYLLPQVELREPIENGVLAAVPFNDDRLSQIKSREVATNKLVSSFTDQFGRVIRPSALLRLGCEPAGEDFYAITAFRNAISISTTCLSWANLLTGDTVRKIMWSDHFDFYPFSSTRNGTELLARSVAINMELDRPGEFAGQRAPHLPSPSKMFYTIDRPILDLLMQAWRLRFVAKRNDRKLRVLFRALETACLANRLPAVGSQHPTIHDVGVCLGLWVSAFEILSHPGNHDVSRTEVLDLLSLATWGDASVKKRRFTLKNRKGEPVKDSTGVVRRFNLCEKIYAELYRARNDFMHGNTVRISSVFAKGNNSEMNLLNCAPVLFRVALAAYLGAKGDRISAAGYPSMLSADIAASFVHFEFERALKAFWQGSHSI
jgi:hypothetical protein